MKYGYKETRRIEMDKIRHLCVRKNWFNCGDVYSYDKLLNYSKCENITSDELVEMAELILENSETDYTITDIMFELAEICYSYFEEC
jgi:hypothetical protein